jgi:hypothetical protein
MDKLDPGAVDALRNHQQQLDRDGVFVGVSRQALDEMLAWYDEAAARIRELEAAAKPFADLDVAPGRYVVCVAVLDDPDFDGADVLRLRQALGGDNG